uniref:SWIM-type domain-containing protein n=1 Tax=Ciona intestinalis TaxID=7719 RepID=H2XLZ5_CIOIN
IEMFSCEFCPLVLASKGSYFNHRKRKHQNEYLRSLQQNGKGFCCSLCKFSAPSNKDMIYHYNIVHEKGLKLLHEQFAMERDFAAWKENLQTETKTLYVQLKKTRQQMDYEVIYFGCNRSGKYVPKDDATHCTKSQGTSKFGGKCPVYMIKRTHLSSGLISVEYCSDHVGHDEEICHLRLSTKIRSKICGKLASGMEPKKVLDYIRDDHRKIDRDAMVTRKDIWNIRKRYHISNVEKHENDTQREDAELLTRAFSALKHKCGDIMTDIFMSDLANNFYNAWTTVFTIPNKRLYCNWHVDKCWRRMIAKTISNLEDQATVYAYLKILHCETEEQKFRKMLQEVNDVLGETSPQFLEYFNNSYVLDDKYKLWASCFRIGSIANNNIKKQYKGVDNLLMTLIKFSRDKCLEQFIKMPKGKSTHWVAEIQKRHRLVRTVTGVVSLGENEWKVENPTDHKYTVKKIEPQCLGKCQIKCSMCNVCVHMYTCTCPDFLMHAVACKHIHAIEISISGGKTFAFQQNRNKEPEVVIENTLVGTSIVRPQSLKANLHKYVDKIHEVIDLVDDEDCLKALGKRLVLGVAVAKGMRPTESFPRGTNMSSNKHFDTQKRFYSTQAKVGRKRKNRL